jgi:hypothetical protein
MCPRSKLKRPLLRQFQLLCDPKRQFLDTADVTKGDRIGDGEDIAQGTHGADQGFLQEFALGDLQLILRDRCPQSIE